MSNPWQFLPHMHSEGALCVCLSVCLSVRLSVHLSVCSSSSKGMAELYTNLKVHTVLQAFLSFGLENPSVQRLIIAIQFLLTRHCLTLNAVIIRAFFSTTQAS